MTKAKIISLKEETHDVKSFFLEPYKEIDFIPGQYCLVSIEGNEEFKDEKRPFTFANSPTKKDGLQLTIKKMGKFTSALHELNEGDLLDIEGPKGESLNFDESVGDDVVFIAGGSGITPFISAIRYAVEKNLSNKLTLIYSNRKKDDIIYKDELEKLSDEGKIKLVNTLTKEDWDGETGRIDEELIKKYVDNLKEKTYYICAPPSMVKAMNKLLKEMGIDKKKIKWEDWQIKGKHDSEE
jgi:NAD(P)H-flavin reductase